MAPISIYSAVHIRNIPPDNWWEFTRVWQRKNCFEGTWTACRSVGWGVLERWILCRNGRGAWWLVCCWRICKEPRSERGIIATMVVLAFHTLWSLPQGFDLAILTWKATYYTCPYPPFHPGICEYSSGKISGCLHFRKWFKPGRFGIVSFKTLCSGIYGLRRTPWDSPSNNQVSSRPK